MHNKMFGVSVLLLQLLCPGHSLVLLVHIVIVFCVYNLYNLLQIVFVELNGLVDQDWSHAAGQVCKIVVCIGSFLVNT